MEPDCAVVAGLLTGVLYTGGCCSLIRQSCSARKVKQARAAPLLGMELGRLDK